MTSKKITYKEYKKLLNYIAYKLIKSGNKYNHRKQYSYAGKKYSYEKVIKKIKKNDKNITSNGYIARFVEKTILKDNKNLDFLPNSVKIGDSKYTQKQYIKAITNTVNYRKKNKQNPKTVTIDYTQKIKLNNYLTNQGCSGMGQCTSYYCACNSLQQMFYRLTGILVSESTIAGWAGTTTDGTDHQGINTAVAMFNKKYNKNVKIKWYNFSELGFDKCKELMKKGALFFHLLYRNRYGHYEVPKAIYENTLDILNSLGNKCGESSYCGYIENRTKGEQRSYINGISQKSVAYLYNG